MKECIEREAIITELMKGTIISDDLYGMGIMSGMDFATKKVVDAPAADVVEVRHGRWEERPVNVDTPTTDLFCSECNFASFRWRYNYCPNCGAKMDKEDA